MKKGYLNLFSLVAIQGGNALFPLVVLPYLFIVLSKQAFSVMVVTESVMFFILAGVLYSFDITAVKKLIELKERPEDKAALLMNITVARLCILLALFVICTGITLVFFQGHVIPLLLWFMFPLGMLLQSNYFHQAEEDNFYFSLVIIVARLLSLFSIYFFIALPTDVELAIALIAGSFIVSGVMSFFIITRKLTLNIKLIKKSEVYLLLKEGHTLFIGNMSVALFRGSNILILSIVANPTAIATYALAEKVIKSIQAFVRPLNQFAFPKVVKNVNETMSMIDVANVIWRHTYPQLMVISTFFIIAIAGYIVGESMGLVDKTADSLLSLLSIMALAILFGISNYMFGTVGLSIRMQHGFYAKAIMYVGIVTLLFSYFMCKYFLAVGAAYAYVFGECLLLVVFLTRYFNKRQA
jgi:PST family polysaccharide transporter